MKRHPLPGFHYGGFARPQILRGAAQPFSKFQSEKFISTTGLSPLLKLHGSLNWSISDDTIEMYQDLRPVWRHGGAAAIVPPTTERSAPDWIRPVWQVAEIELREADTWIVCGYSLPDYDIQVRTLLQRPAETRPIRIILCDPISDQLAHKYKEVAPNSTICPLPGLPDCIDKIGQLLE